MAGHDAMPLVHFLLVYDRKQQKLVLDWAVDPGAEPAASPYLAGVWPNASGTLRGESLTAASCFAHERGLNATCLRPVDVAADVAVTPSHEHLNRPVLEPPLIR
jgi:hypothetical protein